LGEQRFAKLRNGEGVYDQPACFGGLPDDLTYPLDGTRALPPLQLDQRVFELGERRPRDAVSGLAGRIGDDIDHVRVLAVRHGSSIPTLQSAGQHIYSERSRDTRRWQAAPHPLSRSLPSVAGREESYHSRVLRVVPPFRDSIIRVIRDIRGLTF